MNLGLLVKCTSGKMANGSCIDRMTCGRIGGDDQMRGREREAWGQGVKNRISRFTCDRLSSFDVPFIPIVPATMAAGKIAVMRVAKRRCQGRSSLPFPKNPSMTTCGGGASSPPVRASFPPACDSRARQSARLPSHRPRQRGLLPCRQQSHCKERGRGAGAKRGRKHHVRLLYLRHVEHACSSRTEAGGAKVNKRAKPTHASPRTHSAAQRALSVERRRGGDEDGGVDKKGEEERDGAVDGCKADRLPPPSRGLLYVAGLHDGAVKVQVVRLRGGGSGA